MSTSELKSGITQMLKKVKDERLLKVMYSLVKEYTDESESVLTQILFLVFLLFPK